MTSAFFNVRFDTSYREQVSSIYRTSVFNRLNMAKRQRKRYSLHSEVQAEFSDYFTCWLNEVATLAHDIIYKRASLFIRANCLWADSFPPVMAVSTLKNCINCVCSKSARGKKPKVDDSLGDKMRTFWRLHFCKVYPSLLEGEGLSTLKQLLASQMLSCILVDIKTLVWSGRSTFS